MTTLLTLPSPPPSFLYGSIAGGILYFACWYLSPLLTSCFGTPSFKKSVASLEDGNRFHSILPSTIHALVQIIGTYAFVFYGREGYDDILTDGTSPAIVFDDRTIVPYGMTHLGPTVYMGIFVGYLLADIAVGGKLDYPIIIHHLAASACWTFCACNRVMQPVGCLFQFNELSTPLMNIRQYLLTAGYRSSDLPVTISSLSFFFTFALIRVGPLPYVIRDWILRDFSAIRTEIGISGAILLTLFFAVNGALQCGWFAIMCQKFVQMFCKGKQTKVKA